MGFICINCVQGICLCILTSYGITKLQQKNSLYILKLLIVNAIFLVFILTFLHNIYLFCRNKSIFIFCSVRQTRFNSTEVSQQMEFEKRNVKECEFYKKCSQFPHTFQLWLLNICVIQFEQEQGIIQVSRRVTLWIVTVVSFANSMVTLLHSTHMNTNQLLLSSFWWFYTFMT